MEDGELSFDCCRLQDFVSDYRIEDSDIPTQDHIALSTIIYENTVQSEDFNKTDQFLEENTTFRNQLEDELTNRREIHLFISFY